MSKHCPACRLRAANCRHSRTLIWRFSQAILALCHSGAGDVVNHHDFQPGMEVGTSPDPPPVRLLYRPGHYDILYPIPE